MISGTISENGSLLFTWQSAIEKNAMKNLLYKIDNMEFYDDHVIIEEL